MKKSFRKSMAMLLAAVMVLLMVPQTFAAAAETVDNANGGIFAEFVDKAAPEITDYLYVADLGTYHFARIRFQSSVNSNKIYATVVYPKAAGNHPAVLVCHGGGQYAISHEPRMHNLGAAGYIAIAPDLPGIADPEKAVAAAQGQNAAPSEGDWWTNGVYGADHMVESTNPKDNSVYAGVATALEAFNLLKAGSFIKDAEGAAIDTVGVDADNMGVCGLSWGGYTATMVAGIMQEQVRALFSEYGSGYFDISSAWTENGKLAALSESARQCWLDNLDAGRRAQYITADSYFAAASNDDYFHPAAVAATIADIQGETNQVFSPNNSHAVLVPGGTTGADGAGSPAGCAMQINFFDSKLKTDAEPALPVVTYGASSLRDDGFHVIANITAPGEYPVADATLYYSDSSVAWPDREWIAVSATISEGKAAAVIPKAALTAANDYYMLVSDERPVVMKTPTVTESNGVSASTVIYRAPTVEADAIAVDIINYNDDSVSVGAGDGTTYRQFFAGAKANYTINAAAAGIYSVHMSVGTYTDVSYNLFVNGMYCGNGVITGSGSSTYPKESCVLTATVPLSAGENVLTYQGTGGNMNVYSMVLKPEDSATPKLLVDSLGFTEESGSISKRNSGGTELAEGEALASFVLWGGKVTYTVDAPVDGYYSLEAFVATGGTERVVSVTANGITAASNVSTTAWTKELQTIGTEIALKKGANSVTLTSPGLWVFGDGLCFTYEKEWAPAIAVDIMSEETVKYGNTRTDTSNQVLFANGSMEWTIDVSHDGLYTLDGTVAGPANATATLAVWIDGEQAVRESDITYGAAAYTKEAHTIAEEIPLTAGTHTLRVANRVSTVMVYSLSLSKTAAYAPDGYAAFSPEFYDSANGSPTAAVNPGIDNTVRSQVWYGAGYNWQTELAAGTYKVTLLGVASDAYAGQAKLSLDGEAAVDDYIVSTNGYATDAQAVIGTFQENVITQTLQVAETGSHTFTLDSVNQGKFFYFRRLIVERTGDVRPDTIEILDASGNPLEDAAAGNITVRANFFEEHDGVRASLYAATYLNGQLIKVASASRTAEARVETTISVGDGESVKAFLWDSESLAPLCKHVMLRPVNLDPFAGDGDINVVFLGGSITFGSGSSDFANSYASKTGEWLKETYGSDKVRYYNEGVPGTPSNYGLLRLNRDVISHNPDLVFIEFAVNDGGRDSRSNIESIVKMLQACPTEPYIVFLYTTNSSYTTPLHGFEDIASYYDIPQINLKDALYRELSGKNPKDEGYFTDTVHPTDLGHQVYFEEIKACLATGRYYRKPAARNESFLAESGAVETAFLPLSDSSVTASGSWTSGTVSPSWSHKEDISYVKSTAAGDKLSFSFSGTILGIEHGYNKNAFQYEVWVDGSKLMTVNPYYDTTSDQLICDSSTITFDLPEGNHDVEIITAANETGGSSELTLYSVVTGSYVK